MFWNEILYLNTHSFTAEKYKKYLQHIHSLLQKGQS